MNGELPVTLEDDARARTIIRDSLSESLLVEAAAGTGKTYELVQRIVNTLKHGVAEVGSVVAVTFTRKAAGELTLRLRQELDAARAASTDLTERARLEQAIARLEDARIGTIHSFCGEILRERPVEARVDPRFQEADELESARILDQAFARWLEGKLAGGSETVARALVRLKHQGGDDDSPAEKLANAARSLAGRRDFPQPWRRDPYDLVGNIDALVAEVHALADNSVKGGPRDAMFSALEPVRQLSEWLTSDRGAPESRAQIEGRLLELTGKLNKLTRMGNGRYADGLTRDEMITARKQLLERLAQFKKDADADLAPRLRDELWEVVQAYQALAVKLGKLDFVDLLAKVRDLIRDDASVRRYLQARFTHLFVDEVQDTDPLQMELLLLLAADDPAESDWRQVRPVPGKLFLVGDPKQSIYRFRRADVVLYRSVKRQLLDRGVRVVCLGRSFRATAPLQEAVNAAFAPEMTDDDVTAQAGYVPILGGPEAPSTQPSLIALPIPHIHNWQGVRSFVVEESEPVAVAAFVDWLVNHSGFTVRDPDAPDRRVPVSPQHIAILLRGLTRFGRDSVRPYLQGLEARNVPHVLLGSRSLHHRDEIDTILAALHAIEWPDDELSVYATLRGALFAIPDDVLFRFERAEHSLHPFKRLPESIDPDFEPVREALEVLSDLSLHRNDRPFVDTMSTLLAATRAHAGFALRPGGIQVLQNVQRLVDLARSFELSGGISFRAFVEHVQNEAERARTQDSPALEEGTQGVRVLTAHSAKGLEFPVVILAGITSKWAFDHPDRHVDASRGLAVAALARCHPAELLEHQDEERLRDRAEGVRLAYVAATRARDLLVVPTVGEGPGVLEWREPKSRSWYAPLEKVIYPQKDQWRLPAPAVGVPIKGTRSVLSVPERQPGFSVSIAPGLHIGAGGGPGAVWFDPSVLNLDVEGSYGLRQEHFLGSGDPEAAASSIQRYEAWRSARQSALELGEVESIPVLRASAAAISPADFQEIVAEVEAPRDANRPGGARFGTLVHAILRDAPFDADAESIRSLAQMFGRMFGATPEEVHAAPLPVQGALSHDLLKRAARADRVHREYPILFPTDDQGLLDGVIDLAFEENGAWYLVDFKTDRDRSAASAQHVRQMEWYVQAFARTTGREVNGFILYL